MRTKAIYTDSLAAVLHLLTPENRTACLVSLYTGLRISDVLSIRTADVYKTRWTITEAKTGKRKTVRMPGWLRAQILHYAGKEYAFPHRTDQRRHRTRQAVWKDLNKAARVLHLKGVAPHSMRKTFACELRRQGFPETAIQRALNHSSPTITRLYSMAEEVRTR